MQLNGAWTDDAGTKYGGLLWAWGEWEAPSELIQKLYQPEAKEYPKHLWHPYFVERSDSYEGLHNTDPFIFGERFLYANCMQPTFKTLRHLARGSVIAFGSRQNYQWVLDTVFVIADFIDYETSEAWTALAEHAPDAFLHVSARPLTANDKSATLRLYRGATMEESVNGMFSFFPATPAGGDTGFKRPRIELRTCCFTEALPRGIKRTCNLQPSVLCRIWDSLRGQVLDAGLVLGTYAALPERR